MAKPYIHVQKLSMPGTGAIFSARSRSSMETGGRTGVVTMAKGLRDVLTSGTGSMEDILQFAVKPKPVGPIPEVGEVKLEARVLDDTDHIVKVSWSARAQFHKNEIFG